MRRLLFQPAAQSMMIDALLGETFLISMGTSIEKISVKNVTPGMLYVFILKQNNAGSHSIQWGDKIRNAVSADPRPFAVTVQCFIADTGGILESNIPGASAAR